MLCKMTTTMTVSECQYNRAVKDIREEIEENVFHEAGMSMEKFEEAVDETIYFKFNYNPMTEYECECIVGSLPLYLKLEQVASEYYLDSTGEDFPGRGLVDIVSMWRVAEAERWKQEEMENFFNTNC